MKNFYVGVKAIIRDDERGFLVLKAKKGHADIPGGRIDGNESFIETLKREISEELPGTKVTQVEKLVGAYRVSKDIDENTGLVLLYFLVEADLPGKIILSDEHDTYVWVKSVQNIPDGLNTEVRRILEEQLK